jgi:hypothetical protein
MFWSFPKEDLDFDSGEIYLNFISVLLAQSRPAPAPASRPSIAVVTNPEVVGIEVETIESFFAPPSFQHHQPNLSYYELETCALHLSLQLKVLERMGWTLLFWQPSDIRIVNKQFYLLVNLQQVVPLHKPDPFYLKLRVPFIFDAEVVAPELLQLTEIPCMIARSASYYSLGLLCCRLWVGGDGVGSGGKSLADLNGTRLDYFIQRCMVAVPKQRVCQFV